MRISTLCIFNIIHDWNVKFVTLSVLEMYPLIRTITAAAWKLKKKFSSVLLIIFSLSLLSHTWSSDNLISNIPVKWKFGEVKIQIIFFFQESEIVPKIKSSFLVEICILRPFFILWERFYKREFTWTSSAFSLEVDAKPKKCQMEFARHLTALPCPLQTCPQFANETDWTFLHYLHITECIESFFSTFSNVCFSIFVKRIIFQKSRKTKKKPNLLNYLNLK